MREKEAWTIEKSLIEYEKRLRAEAKYIAMAKQVQISQETIVKMIANFVIMKGYYDELKKRYKEDGE